LHQIWKLHQKSDASLEKHRYLGSREEVSQGHFAKLERALPQANYLRPSNGTVPELRGVGFGPAPFLLYPLPDFQVSERDGDRASDRGAWQSL
jgi:hypothetical protein